MNDTNFVDNIDDYKNMKKQHTSKVKENQRTGSHLKNPVY